jgi:type I site-specific restriction-modification system R (restriction) subunit
MEYKIKGSPGEPLDEKLRREIMEPAIERYCTIEASIKESLKQVKLIRNGKLPKKSWDDFVEEMNKGREWAGKNNRIKSRYAPRGKGVRVGIRFKNRGKWRNRSTRAGVRGKNSLSSFFC